MRILLTGATGFVGAHVARALIARGVEVHGMTLPDAPRYRNRGNCVPARATRGRPGRPGVGGRSDPVNRAGRSHSSGVVRGAAARTSGPCPRTWLRYAAGSTCWRPSPRAARAAGSSWPEPASRTSRLPSDVYAAAKAAQHRIALGFAEQSMAAACAHIHYLYGPLGDERRVVPTVTRSLLRGEPIDVTDGRKLRDYLTLPTSPKRYAWSPRATSSVESTSALGLP